MIILCVLLSYTAANPALAMPNNGRLIGKNSNIRNLNRLNPKFSQAAIITARNPLKTTRTNTITALGGNDDDNNVNSKEMYDGKSFIDSSMMMTSLTTAKEKYASFNAIQADNNICNLIGSVDNVINHLKTQSAKKSISFLGDILYINLRDCLSSGDISKLYANCIAYNYPALARNLMYKYTIDVNGRKSRETPHFLSPLAWAIVHKDTKLVYELVEDYGADINGFIYENGEKVDRDLRPPVSWIPTIDALYAQFIFFWKVKQ